MSALRRWLREERSRQNYQAMVRGLRKLSEDTTFIVEQSDYLFVVELVTVRVRDSKWLQTLSG